MQFKLFASLALASIVAAVAAGPARRNELANQCTGTAELQCCDAVTSGSNQATRMLIPQFGIFNTDTTASVGLDCYRISEASGPCKAETVCCTDDLNNEFLNEVYGTEGIVILGCTPSNPNSCPN